MFNKQNLTVGFTFRKIAIGTCLYLNLHNPATTCLQNFADVPYVEVNEYY